VGAPLPVLFVSHGAPDLVLADRPAARHLQRLGRELPRPGRIVVVSAHWQSAPVGITGDARPELIHDFDGFPEPLYALRYPAPGDPELAGRIHTLLETAGVAARIDLGRGLDHGAWTPLRLMFPEATIPVVQVSLPRGPLTAALRLGEALGPQCDGDTLLLASGGTVHNLAAVDRRGVTAAWAAEFEAWLTRTVEARSPDWLADPAHWPETFALAHPSIEHLAPLLVAWAAAGSGRPGRRIYSGFECGNVGMGCFAFDGTADAALTPAGSR